jgi:hypothetical protein
MFILALITIGDIYAGAALTRGNASHTAPVFLRCSYRVWAQTRVSGHESRPERLRNGRKSGGLFDLWTHAFG